MSWQNVKRVRDNLNSRHGWMRLDMNERNSHFPSDFFSKFLSTLTQEDFLAYPEPQPLLKKLAKYHEVKEENIFLGPGSDGVIKTFFEIATKPGTKVISSYPCFPMYKVYAELFETNMAGVLYNSDLELPFNNLLAEIDENTSLIILANPNSPIGDYLSNDKISTLAMSAKDAIILIDEAYYEFAPGTCISLIDRHDNLGIARTFSKAYGAAGLRVGYALGSKSLIDKLYKWRLMEEVNQVGIKFASYLLDNINMIEKFSADVKLEREKLIKLFLNNGFDVIGSNGGWIHIHKKEKQKQVIEYFKEMNVLLKLATIPYDSRRDWIRLSINPNMSNFYVIKEVLKI